MVFAAKCASIVCVVVSLSVCTQGLRINGAFEQTMMTPENVQSLQQQGFVVLRNALPLEQVDALREIADQLFDATKNDKHTVFGGQVIRPHGGNGALIRSLVNVPPNESARDLFETARLLGDTVAKDMMHEGYEWAGHSDFQANTTKGWHRDSPSEPHPWSEFHGETHQLWRVIVYLEDHSQDNGALLILPGSHLNPDIQPPKVEPGAEYRSGTDPHADRKVASAEHDATDPRVHVLHPGKGDAVVIDHRLFHRGGDKDIGRRLVQYSFGRRGNAFTTDFMEKEGICKRGERSHCPSWYDVCICHEWDIENKGCGSHGCGKCEV